MSRAAPLDSGRYVQGDIVPFHFTWWIIILSYFVSLIGAVTTVEGLHRRRAGRDIISQLQLASCALCFGLVAIWCMHFVGNRAITLGDGRPGLQLYYNPGFTTISALLPILFLYIGFFITDRYSKSARSMYMSLVVTGLIAGLSVVGMHYIGNLGTANYNLTNDSRHITGSCAIAVFACWFSFTIFFRQRELWINAWYWRLLCANILAAAVSGMHWTASAGTTYRLSATELASTRNRNENVIVATVLCMLALVGCLTLQLWTTRRRRQQVDRAQHVVLAAFMIDKEGRVLVTQEGLLPTSKITWHYNQRSFNDEFNTSHPVFQWIFRVTRNWQGVADLIPTMRAHLRASGIIRTPSRPTSDGNSRTPYNIDSTDDDNYSAIFREQFCVAAQDLADSLRISLPRLGVLHDEIVMTGVYSSRTKTTSQADLTADVEAGRVIPALFGKGQFLFVANELEPDESHKLSELGYRFAPLTRIDDKVLELISRAMQVRRETMMSVTQRLRDLCSPARAVAEAPMSNPGTYVSCFVLRPALKSSQGGWDVLVDKERPDQIPNTLLFPNHLSRKQTEALQNLDNQPWQSCFVHCDRISTEAEDREMREFYARLREVLKGMSIVVPSHFLQKAFFCAEAVTNQPRTQKTPALIYSFCAIPDVHSSSLKLNDNVAWLSLSFLRCRQRVYKDSPDHSILAQRNHVEFSALLGALKRRSQLSDPKTSGPISRKLSMGITKPISRRLSSGGIKPVSRRLSFSKRFTRRNSNNSSDDWNVTPDESSEKMRVRQRSRETFTNIFGGIMVSQEITVDTEGNSHHEQKRGTGAQGIAVEMRDMGFKTEAGVTGTEQDTFVDDLLKVASAKWQKV